MAKMNIIKQMSLDVTAVEVTYLGYYDDYTEYSYRIWVNGEWILRTCRSMIQETFGYEILEKLEKEAYHKWHIEEFGTTPEMEQQMQDEEMASYEHDVELFRESLEHPQEKVHDHSIANKKSDLCFKREDRKYYIGCYADNDAGKKAEQKRRGIKKLGKRARIREARRFNDKIKSVYRDFAAAEADIWDMMYSHCC